MASYKTHKQGAIIAGGVASVASFSLGMVSIEQAVIVCLVGFLGGLAPDLDHDSSTPCQFVFRFLAVLVPVILISKHPELNDDITSVIFSFGTIAAIIYWPIRLLFQKATEHRGIFHSIPATIIFGEIFFLLMGRQSHDLPYQKAIGISASLGYFTHLLLDEFVSINFTGTSFKPKKSLGTAIDLFKPNKRVTIFAYVILGVLSFLVYRQL